ncbi:MAG: rubrerythrin family protein [Lentisphaerota bacterium]
MNSILSSSRKVMVLAGAVMLAASLGFAEDAAPPAASTLDNLKAAFNGESNAQAKYAAFAVKADEEGYGQVASLFRASAKAESIHAANLARTITAMGAEPKADIKAAEVKTTKENIADALAGETYETEKMYPEFAKQAELDKNEKAIRNFKGAMVVESDHAKFFTEALANLEQWREGTKDFLVCDVCGYTTVDLGLMKCPICAAPRSKMEIVK